MTDSTLSFVNFASLNADKSFWDQIFEVRRYIDSDCSDIWTADKIKQACGNLNVSTMKTVLDEMVAKAQTIINAASETSPIKFLVDAEDGSGIIKIIMSLRHPNEVFNTAGNYESYMDKFTSQSLSYNEFAEEIQQYGNEKFKDLWKTHILNKINNDVQYKLPIASDTILGGIKLGAGLCVKGDGIVSVENVTPQYIQIQSNWEETDDSAMNFIKNKPELAIVATSGNYKDLTNKPSSTVQVQSNWSESDTISPAYIQNKPVIPAEQVNSDWTAVSGKAQILNKPTIPLQYTLQIAKNDTLGGVKAGGANISIDSNGVISAVAAAHTAGEGIKIEQSKISLNPASIGELGGVKPDGKSITANSSGIISSIGGSSFADGQGISIDKVSDNTWKQVSTYSGLKAATYGSDRFVAVGASGKTYYSLDGISWTVGGQAGSYNLEGIAYRNGRFIAVSTNGKTYYSTNGNSWTAGGQVGSNDLPGIVYGNGRFICTSSSGKTYYSIDGISWTEGGQAGSNDLRGIAYGNGRFICTSSSGKTYYSIDNGSSWEASTTTAIDGLGSIVYGDGVFVATGNYIYGGVGWVHYSTDDGVNWTGLGLADSRVFNDVAYSNGRFVAVGASGKNYSSIDGISWTAGGQAQNYDLAGIAYGNGRFVAVGAAILTKCFDSKIISVKTNELVNVMYPIGSVMVRYDTTNPSTLPCFENTTWTQITSGYYIKTATSSIGTTGGSLITGTDTAGSTTLTIANLPSHKHGVQIDYSGSTSHLHGSRTGYFSEGLGSNRSGSYASHVESTGGGEGHTHTIPALSINPTYIQLAFWRRTA